MVHTHLVQTPSAYFLRSSTIPCLFLCLSLRSLLSDVAFLKYIEGCKHHLECGACERVGLKSVSWGFPRKNKSSPSLLPLPYVKGPRSWLLWWSRRKRSVEMHCTVCALTYGTECICSFHVRNTGLGDAKYSCCIRFHTKQIQGSFEQKKKNWVWIHDINSSIKCWNKWWVWAASVPPRHSSLIQKFWHYNPFCGTSEYRGTDLKVWGATCIQFLHHCLRACSGCGRSPAVMNNPSTQFITRFRALPQWHSFICG